MSGLICSDMKQCIAENKECSKCMLFLDVDTVLEKEFEKWFSEKDLENEKD